MNSKVRSILDVILYAIVFYLIQFVITLAVAALAVWLGNKPLDSLSSLSIIDGKMLVAISILSSLVTLVVFIKARWASVSRTWLSTHPWACLAWVVILAPGTILPAQWLQERMEISMPEATVKLFEAVMGEPMGYLAIGILVPIAEELVFRGAILRLLLRLVDQRLHWIAIAVSALLFGIMHGNLPQFVHATLMGLLLGWMYYRTHSIVPGIAFHWVNNTVAYVMFNLMPHMADGKLIDLFHGNEQTMWLGLAFSLCLVVPGLLQLHLRLKRSSSQTQ